jgi:hypothetical protein
MKIKNWIACVQDRGKWKEVVEKAKTFNEEVQRLQEKVKENDKLASVYIIEAQTYSCTHFFYLSTTTLNKGKWSDLHPDKFNPEERVHGSH